ncbi:hypothetical protein [Paenibacillus xerothermodurans]|uniref:Uncharacterized protein n=1 Tax=Paenibacillus xerothermodurans TaxID=1977292 RepID=A0A2W1ND10_PAEXE|nr:hypothetical protein [Paenibacillus xerothermodurans]PZE21550.1 hypothetical protein CBW46_003595 [Paenibacillus xerothermodurans]
MLKKIALFTLTGALAVTGIVAANQYFTKDSSLPEVHVEAHYAYTVDMDKIGEFADLVVVGSPSQDLQDRESVVKYFPRDPGDTTGKPQALESFYTLADFEVQTVYKGDTSVHPGDTIKVREETAVINTAEGKKKLTLDKYPDDLKKGSKYVLFLKKYGDYYTLVRDAEGREAVATDADIQKALEKHKVKAN